MAACILLLAAGSGAAEGTQGASPEIADAAETPFASFSYVFQGMMGEETAQIDLYADGTCRFFLPGNPMITDIYAGAYTREGNALAITGLRNVDASSAFQTPGLWDWIVDGNLNVTVDDAAGTFTPANDASGKTEAPKADGNKNISYASNSDAQVCDIYFPEGAQTAPVIVRQVAQQTGQCAQRLNG